MRGFLKKMRTPGGKQHRHSDSMIQAKLAFFSSKSLLGGLYVAVLSLIFTTPAHAYLDAGTASILLQGLLGGLAVAIASISVFWHKISNFLLGNKSKKKYEEEEEEIDEEKLN